MIRIRRALVLFLAALLVCSFAGCKKSEDTPQAEDSSAVASVDEMLATQGDASAEPEQETTKKDEEQQSDQSGAKESPSGEPLTQYSITGSVTQAAKGSITIADSAGQSYSFSTGGAQKNMQDEPLTGDVLTLSYTGAITGTDTSGVTVVSIADGADNTQNPIRLQAIQDAMEKTVTGFVYAVGGSAATIQTDDGKKLSFLTSQADNELPDGLQEGIRVNITFTGPLTDTDTSGTKVVKITAAQ